MINIGNERRKETMKMFHVVEMGYTVQNIILFPNC